MHTQIRELYNCTSNLSLDEHPIRCNFAPQEAMRTLEVQQAELRVMGV